MSDKPKLPPELVELRPGLAEDEYAQHPVTAEPRLPRPPREYTKAVHEKIVELIAKGHRPEVAAASAGIRKSTFAYWMQLGKSGDVRMAQFVDDVERAYATAEVDILNEILADERDKTENRKWLLERLRVDGYSKDVQLKVNAALLEIMERVKNGCTPQEYIKFLSLATGHQLDLVDADPPLLTDGAEEET